MLTDAFWVLDHQPPSPAPSSLYLSAEEAPLDTPGVPSTTVELPALLSAPLSTVANVNSSTQVPAAAAANAQLPLLPTPLSPNPSAFATPPTPSQWSEMGHECDASWSAWQAEQHGTGDGDIEMASSSDDEAEASQSNAAATPDDAAFNAGLLLALGLLTNPHNNVVHDPHDHPDLVADTTPPPPPYEE